MHHARLIFAAALTMVCGMAYAIPVPERPAPQDGFFSAPSAPSFFAKSSGPRVDSDGHGRPVAFTDPQSGYTVHLLRDQAGRVTELHSPTSHSVLLYSSDAAIRPSTLIRDGVPFRIVTTGEHSVRLQPLHKGTVTADSPDVLAAINGGGDYLDSCSTDPGCADPFPNPFDSMNGVLDGLNRWWAAGFAIGSSAGFTMAIVQGASSLDAIALAAGIGGGVASTGMLVFHGGTQVGTWLYGNFGEWFWLRLP